MTVHHHPSGSHRVVPHDHSAHDFKKNLNRRNTRHRARAIIEMAEVGPKVFSHTRFQGDPVLDLVLNNRRLIKRGSRGASVGLIQQALIDLGFPLPRFGADQDFGSETSGALMDFQRHVRRTIPSFGVDGVVGPNTMEQLDLAIARLRLRKSVTDLSPAERIRFVNAINEWERRGLRNQFVLDHDQASAFAHGNSGFLPWHRQFLLNFESEINAIDDQAYLPYWDWIADPMEIGGVPTWTPAMTAMLGGDGTGAQVRFNGNNIGPAVMTGPIRHWRFIDQTGRTTATRLARAFNVVPADLVRRRRITRDGTRNAMDLAGVMAEPDYDGADFGSNPASPSFRASLERALHNYMHVWVGGHMGEVAVSPNDPAFFLHHAMVDKIWADWQAANPAKTYVPATRTGSAPGRTDAMRVRNLHDPRSTRTVTPAAALDNGNLTDSFGKTGLNVRYI